MWSDLVKAYESKIEVLEAARNDYARAVRELLEGVHKALFEAVSQTLGEEGPRYTLSRGVENDSAGAVFSGANTVHASILDPFTGAEFSISAWVASCFGGPASTLRIGLSLDNVGKGVDYEECKRTCKAADAGSVPGDPADFAAFPDVASDWKILRIVSVALSDKDLAQVGAAVGDAASALAKHAEALLAQIHDRYLPLLRAQKALEDYKPVLRRRCEALGERPFNGSWLEGYYLQVGCYWLCTDPLSKSLRVEGKEVDEELVRLLAQKGGFPLETRKTYPSFVLIDEAKLRDWDHPVEEEVARAFEAWFEDKEAGPAAASGE